MMPFWAQLKSQFSPKLPEPPQYVKQERIENFLKVPFELEKFLFFGVLVCLDSFLYNITILPLRIVYGVFHLVAKLRMDYANDFILGFMVVLVCFFAFKVDISGLYHSIRSQSTLKLYVIFNVLEVLDKLFSSFGLDLMDSYFSQRLPGKSFLRSAFQFGLCIFYIFIHSFIYIYQILTLNVAVNSSSNSVLSLLVSNQFMELKSSVFKKFERENLFQLAYSDCIERFQLFLFLFSIAARNLNQIGFAASEDIWNRIVYPLLMVHAAEICVDSMKHSFITKFNHIHPDVYRYFKETLASDFLSLDVDQSTIISRKMGFSALPHTCFVLVLGLKLLKGKVMNYWMVCSCFFALLIFKIILQFILNRLFESARANTKIEDESKAKNE